MSDVLGVSDYTLFVTNYQMSQAGTTLLYLDVVLPGTDPRGADYDIVTAFAQVKALFQTMQRSCAATTPVGCPAVPALIAAFAAHGLPAAGAYYNQQYKASTYVPGPPPDVDPARVGTWQLNDNGEAVVLDIPFDAYAPNQAAYKEAFSAGMSQALNVGTALVSVTNFQRSESGTTILFFDIINGGLGAATSSEATTAQNSHVRSLFESCRGQNEAPVGCRALSALNEAFKSYGLPIVSAYYNEQPLSPPPPLNGS